MERSQPCFRSEVQLPLAIHTPRIFVKAVVEVVRYINIALTPGVELKCIDVHIEGCPVVCESQPFHFFFGSGFLARLGILISDGSPESLGTDVNIRAFKYKIYNKV